ncbi:sugar ABC transporter substrate-binding protein [Streptomyces himalayensis]|uniref:Substrate-binding domain-containing protein n=1 Tax=Streptomyces himalayensis subsp. himalayensis TaxID=2756131 RepID=A0A7W0DJC5_9ACTN|nr:substrate-binding domain-containing protein [Streptomyces himalayensis subsp. himalayensis]
MNVRPSRAVLVLTVLTMALGAAACAENDRSGSDEGGLTIGLLLPGDRESRYWQFDKPLIEKKIKELCGDCRLVHNNTISDAAIQRQQMESMINKGVEVLILGVVDPPALRSTVEDLQEAGIPVVAYDRLAEGPISGHVTFDGAQVGRIQAEALLKAMGHKADGGRIVMMNGAITDPNAGWFKRGAMSVLKGKVKIAKTYDTVEWREENAHTNMSGAIAALGVDGVDGVYAANDRLASGAIAALKAAGVTPLPPVTGQDADLAAVQRIVTGDQYMTVYKPFKPEADAAATMAVALGRGESLEGIAKTRLDSATTKDIPTVLLTPLPVTVDNIEETVVKDGMYTIGEICTPEFRSACDKAGLTR